jgi:hypothetical protein
MRAGGALGRLLPCDELPSKKLNPNTVLVFFPNKDDTVAPDINKAALAAQVVYVALLERIIQRLRHPRCSSDGKVANRDVRDFGWEIAHEAVTPRPPIFLDTMVPRAGAILCRAVSNPSITILCFAVSNPSITIRHFCAAAGSWCTCARCSASGTKPSCRACWNMGGCGGTKSSTTPPPSALHTPSTSTLTSQHQLHHVDESTPTAPHYL